MEIKIKKITKIVKKIIFYIYYIKIELSAKLQKCKENVRLKNGKEYLNVL